MKILVLSDIHGNVEALEAVSNHVSTYDGIWVLGDLVDYGPEPHIVVDLISELKPDVVLRGNHDYAVSYGADCRCGEKTHDLSVYTRENISLKFLSKDQMKYLRNLSVSFEVNFNSLKMLLVHGSPRDPLYGYMLPSLPLDELGKMTIYKKSNFSLASYSKKWEGIVLSGHTHIPAKIEVDKALILNPGSVGQPRDGDFRASYGVFDADKTEFTVYRVNYNIEKKRSQSSGKL
ncbi:MAG: metallophosphoesterase family protein [Desulfurococcaceae archaeon]